MKGKRLGWLVFILVVGIISGCSSNKEDMEEVVEVNEVDLLVDALSKTKDAISVEGVHESWVDYKSDNHSVKPAMAIDYKIHKDNKFNDDNIESSLSFDLVTIEGEDQSGIIYSKDNIYYLDVYGLKAIVLKDNTRNFYEHIEIIPVKASIIESIKMEEKDGEKILQVQLSEKGIKEIAIDAAFKNMAAEHYESDAITVKKYTLTYVIKDDGYVYNQDLSYQLHVQTEAGSAVVTGRVINEITTYEEHPIEFPDFSEYTEIN